jgi:hypothetical protein
VLHCYSVSQSEAELSSLENLYENLDPRPSQKQTPASRDNT